MKSPTRVKFHRLQSVILLSATALILSACGGSNAELKACLQNTSTGGVSVGSGLPGDPAIPEKSSGYKLGNKVVSSATYMAVTANPRATQAGCEVLNAGGTAADAAVAIQTVLGLVEPQSSGLGGGAFTLYYKASTKQVLSYDGRETAPAAATDSKTIACQLNSRIKKRIPRLLTMVLMDELQHLDGARRTN
jgi:gamma-glutamyltranspeptidase/glutathione hydrolase